MGFSEPTADRGRKRPSLYGRIAKAGIVVSAIGLLKSLNELLSADYATSANRLMVGLHWLRVGLRLPASDHSVVRLNADLWPFYLVFFVSMFVICWYEAEEQIIPDAVTIPGIFIGMGMSIGYGHRYIGLIQSIAGMLIGLALPLGSNVVYRRWKGVDGFGLGVIKMAGMIGAFLGPADVVVTLFGASIIGSIYGLYAVIRYGKSAWRDTFEFGPMIALMGSLCAIFPLSAWYISLYR